MDITRFERLAETVERMLGPTGHDAASEAHGHLARANEPRRGWWKHHEPADAQTLFPQAGRPGGLRLNMKVGQGAGSDGHIRGLSAVTFTALESETREVVGRPRRHDAGNGPGMIAVAAEVLGLGPQAARMLLTGPNWLGEAASWVEPAEAAQALRAAAAERDVNRCWRHLDRKRLQRLHAAEDPAAYLLPWAREMVDDTLAAYHPAMHEARVHDEVRELLRLFPWGTISPKARIDPRAHIGEGVSIGDAAVRGTARIGARAVIANGAVIEEGTVLPDSVIGVGATICPGAVTGSVGAETRIANGSRVSGPVGERTRIGHGCQIEGPVGDDTTTGDSVKSRVAIGDRCSIGSRGELGAPRDDDEPREAPPPRLADGSKTGCEARITANWRGSVMLRMGDRAVVDNVTTFPTRAAIDNDRRIATLDDLAEELGTKGNEARLEPGAEWGPAEPPARGVHAKSGATVLPGAAIGEGTTLESGSGVGGGAEIGRFVLLERDATVGDKAVVGDATRIGARSRVRPGAEVGADTSVEQDVDIDGSVGNGCEIGPGVIVARGATVGDGVRLGANARIGRGATVAGGARLGPAVEIGAGGSVGEHAEVGNAAVSGDNAAIGPFARVGAGVEIEADRTVGRQARLGRCCTVVSDVADEGVVEDMARHGGRRR